MVRRARRSLSPQVAPAEQGALLVEALVVSVVITIALLGTAASINIATQQRNRAGERNQLNAAIDADLTEIQDLATQITCCSGECTLGIPGGVTPDDTPPFESPCFTDNRRDNRYFFPQIDDPATTNNNEPDDVRVICNELNQGIISDAVLGTFNSLEPDEDDNGTPDLEDAGGSRDAIVRLNAVQNQPGNQNILKVTYRDTNANNAVVRVARVVPPMAAFCP